MPDVVAEVPGRVLAVYAHPDDLEVACGGTLACWAAGGAEVRVVIGTRGDKGASTPADPDELAARRAGEVADAASALGVAGVEMLGHADGELDNTSQLRGAVVGAVRRHRPDAVVCPDPTAVFFGDRYVNHHDHRGIGWATLDAVAPMAASPLYFPDTGAPHRVASVYLSGTLEPNSWVDVATTLDAKVAALLCHRSQLEGGGEWLPEFVRRRAEDEGRPAGLGYAEAFRRLDLRA